MHHTFLFEEAVWQASGQFLDGVGNPAPLAGETRITHADSMWINDSWMQIGGEAGPRFESRYEVTPFAPGALQTTWTSHNPQMGDMAGTFAIVVDALISSFRIPNGKHYGSEILLIIKPDLYLNRGAMFEGDVRLSSWAVQLQKSE